MEQEQIKHTLEALLFVAGKPLTVKDFSKILELEASSIKSSLDELVEEKKESGIILLENNGEYQLSTNSSCSTQVKNFLNSELREKLTDATVEVLAIIAYRQPISKAEIEAIRGVNSQYSVRNLLMRGLIEKVANPHDARSFLYQTTTEFLMHMGIASVSELPEFQKLVENIKLPQTAGLTGENSLAHETQNTEQETEKKEPEMELPQESMDGIPPATEESAEEIDEEDEEEEDEDDEE